MVSIESVLPYLSKAITTQPRKFNEVVREVTHQLREMGYDVKGKYPQIRSTVLACLLKLKDRVIIEDGFIYYDIGPGIYVES